MVAKSIYKNVFIPELGKKKEFWIRFMGSVKDVDGARYIKLSVKWFAPDLRCEGCLIYASSEPEERLTNC